MANVKSAIKRARQNDKRRERNDSLRSAAKTAVKGALVGINAAKTREEGLKALIAGERAVQKAVSKGILPKSRASRKTARLAALLNKKFAPTKSAASARK